MPEHTLTARGGTPTLPLLQPEEISIIDRRHGCDIAVWGSLDRPTPGTLMNCRGGDPGGQHGYEYAKRSC